MSLPERLRDILAKLRSTFDSDIPDPDTLDHSGEVEVKGQTFIARSSVPLSQLEGEDSFTVYLHTKPSDNDMDGPERIRYFHAENRREISAILVSLDYIEGRVQQSTQVSSLPREIFMQRVDRALGRGGGRRDNQNRFGGGGRGRPPMPGQGGRGRRSRPRPMMMMRKDESVSPLASEESEASFD